MVMQAKVAGNLNRRFWVMPQWQKIPWNESICQNANSANTTPKLVYTMTGLSNTNILPQTPQQTAVQDNHEITERSRKRAGADYRDIYIKTLLKAVNKKLLLQQRSYRDNRTGISQVDKSILTGPVLSSVQQCEVTTIWAYHSLAYICRRSTKCDLRNWPIL